MLSQGLSEEQVYYELTHKTTWDNINSWGCFRPGSGIVKNYSSACMSNASLALNCKEFWIHNVRKYSEKLDDPVFFAWTCWISDPEESPWKAVLPKEPECIVKGINVYNTNFRNRYGWFFKTTEHVGYATFINFCKTVRNPTERRPVMAHWWDLVQRGVHPALAYILSFTVVAIGTSTISISKSGIMPHGAVDVQCLCESEVKNFALCSPKDTTKPLCLTGTYMGNDGIWRNYQSSDLWQATVFDGVGVTENPTSLGKFSKVPVVVSNNQETIKTVPLQNYLRFVESERIRLQIPKSKLLERIEREKLIPYE